MRLLNYSYSYFIDCFMYISPYAFLHFNCLSFKLSFYYMNILQKMVCLLWGL